MKSQDPHTQQQRERQPATRPPAANPSCTHHKALFAAGRTRALPPHKVSPATARDSFFLISLDGVHRLQKISTPQSSYRRRVAPFVRGIRGAVLTGSYRCASPFFSRRFRCGFSAQSCPVLGFSLREERGSFKTVGALCVSHLKMEVRRNVDSDCSRA